jgi:hypothetical protein
MSVRPRVRAGETADMHGQRPYKPAASLFAAPPGRAPEPRGSRNITHHCMSTILITHRACPLRQAGRAVRPPRLDAAIDLRWTSDVPAYWPTDLPRTCVVMDTAPLAQAPRGPRQPHLTRASHLKDQLSNHGRVLAPHRPLPAILQVSSPECHHRDRRHSQDGRFQRRIRRHRACRISDWQIRSHPGLLCRGFELGTQTPTRSPIHDRTAQ